MVPQQVYIPDSDIAKNLFKSQNTKKKKIVKLQFDEFLMILISCEFEIFFNPELVGTPVKSA